MEDRGVDPTQAEPVLDAERRTAVTRLFEAHRGDLDRFLARQLSDPSERDDVAQEVFLRLARYDALDEIDSPRSFLFRMAHNLIRDRARRAAVRSEASHMPIEDALLVDPAPGPERVTLDREALALAKTAILSLPPRRRAVFLLSRFDGLTYREIAERLGISQSAVEKHVSAALLHCRLELGYEDPRASSKEAEDER